MAHTNTSTLHICIIVPLGSCILHNTGNIMCANIVTGHATDDDDDAPLVMAPGSVFQAIIPPIILISDKLLLGERERRSFHHGNDVLFVAAFVES